MSNQELQAAIDSCYSALSHFDLPKDVYPALESHLKFLLQEQRGRLGELK